MSGFERLRDTSIDAAFADRIVTLELALLEWVEWAERVWHSTDVATDFDKRVQRSRAVLGLEGNDG